MNKRIATTVGAAAAIVALGGVAALTLDQEGAAQQATQVAAKPRKPAKPGDLNGDGRRDLILPSPDGRAEAGARGFFTVVQSGPGGPGPGPVAHRRLVTATSVGLPKPSDVMNGFGGVAVSADFDRDGFADLATDTSPADVSSNKGRPLVIVYGGPHGLTKRKVVLPTPDGFGASSLVAGDFDGNGVPDLVATTSLEFSYLAYANIGNRPVQPVKTTFARSNQEAPWAGVTVADFNHDGRSDLALAAEEWEDEGPRVRGWGEVHLGTPKGLAPKGKVYGRGWTYGRVASGDVNGDGRADLVVRRYVKKGPGAFSVLLGTKQGLGKPKTFTQNTPGVPDSGQAKGHFGDALAVGDVNGDRRADVAVGAPGQKVGRAAAAGTVTLFHGAKGGLTAKGARVITQNTKGVPGTAESYDEFGGALSLADLTGDGKADLTVGVPGENTGNVDESGWIYFLPGSRSGLTVKGLRYFGPQQLKIAGRGARPGEILLP